MKRVITIVLLLLCTLVCGAQARFEKSVELGYQKGLDKYLKGAYCAEFVGYYRFGRVVSVGVGTGVDLVDYMDGRSDGALGVTTDWYSQVLAVPVYGRLRLELPVMSAVPFVFGDLGYSLGINGMSDGSASGAMADMGLGVAFPMSSGGRLSVAGGFFSRCTSYRYSVETGAHPMIEACTNGVTLRLGYSF